MISLTFDPENNISIHRAWCTINLEAMTMQEEFETLKSDYIQKTQMHLKEMQALQIDDFNKVTNRVDMVLTQHAASLSFLSLSLFIQDQRRKQQP